MKIGLIDVDGHNFPNLPLMKISAWHKAHGDSVEWYQGILSDHMDRVYMSKVFSFTPDYEWVVDADEVIRGGSGYAIDLVDGKEVYHKERDADLPYKIEHTYPDYSLYGIDDTAYGFLTRGCIRNCSFCHVCEKEGRTSHKTADLDEFWKGQKNIILCDPNILAYQGHKELLQQLVDSKAYVELNQGIDVRLITNENIDLLRQIKMKMVHFAFDHYDDKDIIVPKLQMYREATGYGHNKVMVFVLVNFDSTLEQDLERIYTIRDIGFEPYVMIYDKEHCDSVYKRLQRWCNSKFIFRSTKRFEEYNQ